MPGEQRKRSGLSAHVKCKIQAGDIVQVGWPVAKSGQYVVPPDAFTDSQTSSFGSASVGVLVSGGTTGDETTDTECLVETEGEFEYDCVPLPGDQAVGTPMGPADGGSTLSNTTMAVTVASEAIGRLARPGKSGDTKCLIRIKSAVMADTL